MEKAHNEAIFNMVDEYINVPKSLYK